MCNDIGLSNCVILKSLARLYTCLTLVAETAATAIPVTPLSVSTPSFAVYAIKSLSIKTVPALNKSLESTTSKSVFPTAIASLSLVSTDCTKIFDTSRNG